MDTDAKALPTQRILVVDDEKVIGIAFRRVFSPEGHEVDAHEDPHEGLQAALTGNYDVIFLDWMMPGADGFEILRAVKAAGVRSEVVIITGHSTIESAVQAIRDGAADYLSKPFTPDQLRLVFRKVVERSSLIVENALLRKELEVNQGLEGIIGESRPMQRVFGLMKRVAPTDGTVLIVGESGTGKEMVVNAIHRLSRRRDKALLACDCSALAPTLLESELFGHVKGSFSGAISTKQGLFEAADKGTLFLDEVSNLSTETQGKLLARAGGEADQKGRRYGRTGGRHPPGHRHQPRPVGDGRGGRVPRRPLLSTQRRPDPAAAAARTTWRYPAPGGPFPGPVLPEAGGDQESVFAGRAWR